MNGLRGIVGWLLSLLAVAGLAACGGGGGGGGGGTTGTGGGSLSLSTNSLSFSTLSQQVTPAAQTITATVTGVTSGTLYFKIVVTGSAVQSVSNITITGPTMGQATVTPAPASGLGPGTFTSTITVYACTTDPNCSSTQLAGSPQFINVTYNIQAATTAIQTVAPYVGTANAAGNVVIRGISFSQVSVQNVMFGSTAATSFTAISDSEIRAQYPALSAGTYPLSLQTSGGTVSASASLVVVSPPGYSAAALNYPDFPAEIRGIVFDAERQAILVSANYGTTWYDAANANNKIIRFGYSSGAWQSPTSVTIGNLRDIALSSGGSDLLALAETSLTQVNPSTLALGTVTSAPGVVTTSGGWKYLKSIAVTNDGYAIVPTGVNGTGSTEVFRYLISSPAFTTLSDVNSGVEKGNVRASADGSLAVVTSAGSNGYVYRYLASSASYAYTGFFMNQTLAPAVDRAATRVAIAGDYGYNGSQGVYVYDGTTFNNLGALILYGANSITASAIVIKPDATRAYVYDYSSQRVRTFDLTQAPIGGLFPEIGSGTTLTGDPGQSTKMTISPDGGTIFLAGSSRVIILPAP